MSKGIKENQRGYDLWSKTYDTDLNSTVAVDESNFPVYWKHLVNKDVVEIGCGTGRHTIKLARAKNRVTAIEASRKMLEVARVRTSGLSVEFVETDFFDFSGSENGFDAAVMSLVLEHIANPSDFFIRLYTLIKPGGEFYLSEIHPLRIAKGTQAHFTHPETGSEVRLVSFAHTDSEIKEASAAAGFQLINEADIHGTEELAMQNENWKKHLNQPMIKIWVFRK
jgi:2-polyprenyl-3-methyl-5-hydroxy-6-metoxy-1,4-benzoquinol methylase